MQKYSFALIFTVYVSLFALAGFVKADIVRDITFPVSGTCSFINDFGDPRNGGTTHHRANDIMAAKMTPLVSVVDGYVSYMVIPEASWGYSVFIKDDDGYEYHYIHMNDDTPGTDDGKGGVENAYAPGLIQGMRVSKGQLIGWVGDSGNAEGGPSHLHFEIDGPDKSIINPYASLVAAAAVSSFKNQIHIGSATATAVTTTPTTATTTSSSAYVFTKTLYPGARGEEVIQLQKKLKALGFYIYSYITGYFGPITKSAVASFQRANSISPIGAVGPLTRAALNH